MKISPVNFSLKRYRRRHWTCIPGCGSFKYFFNASKFHRNWGIYFGSFTSFQPRSSKSELFGWVLLISSKIQWVLSFLVSIPTSWNFREPQKEGVFGVCNTQNYTFFFLEKHNTFNLQRLKAEIETYLDNSPSIDLLWRKTSSKEFWLFWISGNLRGTTF